MKDKAAGFHFNVTVDELRKVVDILSTRLEQLGYNSVEIPQTYYWHIPTAQLYSPADDPTDLDIGDVSDDWEELLKIVQDPELAVTDGFSWLSAVCRAIADHTSG